MVLTEKEIINLVSTTSYTPSSIPLLEEYVKSCCTGEMNYIFDAVRTLIKLYQLFPLSTTSGSTADSVEAAAAASSSSTKTAAKSIRTHYIAYCCFLAMIQYPNTTDLLAFTYMIPQTTTLKEPCSFVFKCAEHLKSCHYTDFWKCYETHLLQNQNDSVLKQMATSNVSIIQQGILHALSLSYKRAPLQVVKDACNIPSTSKLDSTTPFIKSSTVVESVTSESAVFKPTVDNTKRQRVYQEGVSYNSISALLGKMGQ